MSVDLGVIQLQLAHNGGLAFSMGDRLPARTVTLVTAAIILALPSTPCQPRPPDESP